MALFGVECKKIFCTPWIYIFTLVFATLYYFSMYQGMETVEEHLSMLLVNGSFWGLSTVCMVIPYGISYYQEKSSGNLPFILQRAERKNYCISKALSCFVSGGFVAAFGMAFFALYVRYGLGIPFATDVSMSSTYWADILLDKGLFLEYWIGMFVTHFLYGGVVSVLGCIFSMVILNPFVAVIGPHMSITLFTLITGRRDKGIIPELSLTCVAKGDIRFSNFFSGFIYIVCYFTVVFVIEYFILRTVFLQKEYESGEKEKFSLLMQFFTRKKDISERKEEKAEKRDKTSFAHEACTVFSSIRAMVQQNIRKWATNPRIWVLLFFLLLNSWQQTEHLAEASREMEVGINMFALFPVLYGNSIDLGRTIMGIGILFLFCDAPFIDSNQQFAITRAGKKRFCIAQLFYIVISALFYTFYLAFIPCLFVISRIGFAKDWGTLFRTIAFAKDGDNGVMNILISARMIKKYTAVEAWFYQVTIFFLVVVFLGLVIFLFNFLFGKMAGVIIAGIFLMLGRIPYLFTNMNWVYWISPVSLAEIKFLDVNGRTQYPPVWYAYVLLIFLIVMLSVAIYFSFQRKHIMVKEEV